MTITSRWTVPVPRCSLQQWIFGSACGPLDDFKVLIDPERPDTHFLTMEHYRLLAKRVALGLQAAGLKPGDRVLLFSNNHLYFPAIFIGVLMAGGIFTGANPSFVARELAYQVRDSGARFLITAQAALPTALAAAAEVGLPRERMYVLSGDAPGSEVATSVRPKPGVAGRQDGVRHWTELLAGNEKTAQGWSWTEPADPEATTCCLNYSSGTTGVPKGVEISHYAYVANGTGVQYISDISKTQRRDSGLCFLPMYHAYSQTYFIANYPRMGTSVYVMPRFDLVKMLEYVQRFRITTLTCVPPIMVALAKNPIVRTFDLSSIASVGCGAAPLSSDVSTAVNDLFPVANKVRVRQGWGMTELTCTCMNFDPTMDEDSSGVGELMPNCAARLMALDQDGVAGAADGTPIPIREANVRGELWVTGPTLMRGYWKKPDATAATVVADADGTRWLRTGDIAYVERYEPGAIFHVVDRVKELIKVNGNQVAPAELEALLLERRDVLDAAVVGVTIGGAEVPRAYVVRDPAVSPSAAAGPHASERDIADWLAARVARYKQLRGGVRFTDAIPKNPSGKILRKQLRERARQEVGDRAPLDSKLA